MLVAAVALVIFLVVMVVLCKQVLEVVGQAVVELLMEEEVVECWGAAEMVVLVAWVLLPQEEVLDLELKEATCVIVVALVVEMVGVGSAVGVGVIVALVVAEAVVIVVAMLVWGFPTVAEVEVEVAPTISVLTKTTPQARTTRAVKSSLNVSEQLPTRPRLRLFSPPVISQVVSALTSRAISIIIPRVAWNTPS